jgi:autotransporter-associated beta strand protein
LAKTAGTAILHYASPPQKIQLPEKNLAPAKKNVFYEFKQWVSALHFRISPFPCKTNFRVKPILHPLTTNQALSKNIMKTPHVIIIKSIGNHLKPARILAGSIAALLAVPAAQAVPLRWDITSGDGATITDGLGTWSDAAGNWNNGADTVWANATPDDAIFGGGTLGGFGTVTLGSAITAGSLTFNTPNGGGAYTIDTSTFALTLNTGITANESASILSGVGGSLALGGASAWSVAATKNLTVGAPVSGGFGITKSGTGTLTLSGANTYSGTTTVSAGTMQFATTGSLYNSTTGSWTAANINVKSSGTLAFNVGGAGEFTTGDITTLLTNLAASSSTTNGMNAGSNFGFDTTNASGGTFTIADVIANSTGTSGGARGLTKLGTNTLVLSNADNTYTGTTTINGGTLAIGGAGRLNSGNSVAVTITSGTFQYGSSANQTLSTVTGAGALTKTGSGTLTLSGGGVTHSGTTTISQGTLRLTKADSGSYTSAISVNSGGTLALNGTNWAGSQNITLNGGTLLTDENYGYVISSKVVNVTDNSILQTNGTGIAGNNYISEYFLDQGLNITSGKTLTFNPSTVNNGIVLRGNTSPGSGSLVVSGVGTTSLVGRANLQFRTDGASNLANADVTLTNATMNVGRGLNDANAAGATVKSLSGNGRVYADTTNNTLTVGQNDGSGTFSGVLANGTAVLSLVKTGSGTQVLSGLKSYTGTTAVNGGTLVLSGPNTTTGIMTINGGTLQAGSATAFGSADYATLLFGSGSTGKVRLDGNSVTVVGLNTNATVGTPILENGSTVVGTDTLTVNNAAANTFAGVLQDGSTRKLALTKGAAGTLTLSGTNTYSGGTAINGGTLLAAAAANLPSAGNLTINAGGTFSMVNSAAVTTYAANSLTLADGANLSFDLVGTNTTDLITSTNAAVTAGGNIGISITGSSTPVVNAATTLISSPSGGLDTGGTSYFVANNTDYTATLVAGPTDVQITSYTGSVPALTNAYWKRNQLAGAPDVMALSAGTSSNWDSDALGTSAGGVVPGGNGVNVIFSATGATSNVTVGADMNLGSITFNDLNNAVTIGGSNTITLNSTATGAATSAGDLGSVTAGSAISVTSSANANNTINAGLALGAAQTWNVASGKTLAVNGKVYNRGNLLTIGGDGDATISGEIIGAGGLTKTSTGILTVSGNNTFTGTTTISAGTLKVGAAGAIPTPVAVTSTLDLNGQSPTIRYLTGAGSVINSGGSAVLTLNLLNSGAQTFSGGISGTVRLVVQNFAAKNADLQVLTGTNNYTGGTLIDAGQIRAADEAKLGAVPVSFDAANITLSNGGVLQNYDSHLVLNANRGITLGTGGGMFYPGWSKTITVNGVITGSGSLTKLDSGPLVLTAANTYTGPTIIGAGTLQLGNGGTSGSLSPSSQITNGGSLTFNRSDTLTQGTDFASVISSSGSISQNGTGTTILSGLNTYGGKTFVNGGVLSVSSLANSGQPSNIGAYPIPGAYWVGSTFYGALELNGGTFRYTGSSTTTDLGFRNNSNSTIEVSSPNTTLTFGGCDIGRGVLNVTGAPGTRLVMGITRGEGSNSDKTLNPTTINMTVNGFNLFNSGGNPGLVLHGTSTDNRITGIIDNTVAAVTKSNTSTWTLSAANAYFGGTFVNGGTLGLDFSAATAPASNIINNATNVSALTLGGGTLSLTGKASTTNSQRFNGLTALAGSSAIVLNANATANPLVLTLGALTRATGGGTVDFTLPTGTQDGTNGVTTTSTGFLNNNVLTHAAGGTAFATVGGNDWATLNGTGNIVGYDSLHDYTATTGAGGAGTTASNYTDKNIDVNSSEGLLSGPITPNTLRFNTNVANTVTLAAGTNMIGAGGILVTSTVGGYDSTITGDTLAGSTTGKDLVVIQNNTSGGLTISSVIADNASATALTKAGPGTLTLSGVNTYTGVTTVYTGTLSVSNLQNAGSNSHIGNFPTVGATGLVLGGGTLKYTGGNASIDRGFTLSTANSTIDVNNASTALKLGASSLGAFTLNVTGGTGSTLEIGAATLTAVVQHSLSAYLLANTTIAPSIPLTIASLSGSNQWVTFNGPSTSTVTGATTFSDSAFIISNGTLSLSTITETAAAGKTITLGGTGTGTVSEAISQNLANALAITKSGTGTWTLSGTNTYTGTTTISAGTLTVAPTGTINNTSGVSIGAGNFKYNSSTALSKPVSFTSTGGTLSGTGTITPAVTVTSGNTLSPGASAGPISFGNGLTISPGGILNWEHTAGNAVGLTPGTDWDVVNVTGTTTISIGSNLNLKFSTGTDFSHAFWNDTQTWKFIVGGVTAGNLFDTSNIDIFVNEAPVGSGNTISGQGAFSTVVNGNDLDLTWTVSGATASYATWAAGLSTSSPPLSDTAADADPDKDGLSNAYEYIHGSDPRYPNQGGPTGSVVGTNLQLTFTRTDSAETADVSLLVQVSTDLSDWTSIASYPIGATSSAGVLVNENDALDDEIIVTIPKGTDVKKFARLIVVVTP